MSQRTVNPRRPSHAPPGPRLAALEPVTSDTSQTGFAEFGVSKPVVDALKMRGISGAFAIQELVLRDAIAGRDVLARSRTGSGKTLAFAVPIVERLTPSGGSPTALILAPTRELAAFMMSEAQQVAAKLGVTFRVSIDKRIAGAERVGAHKTSMLQDIEAGREPEIEALVGSVVELARLTETPTPHIDAVYALTRLLGRSVSAPA